MLVKIEQKYLENLTYCARGHSNVKFALKGKQGSIEMRAYANRREGDVIANVRFPYKFPLSTRFFNYQIFRLFCQNICLV